MPEVRPAGGQTRRGGTPQSLSSLCKAVWCWGHGWTLGPQSRAGTPGVAQGAELSHVEGAVPGGAGTRGRAALGQTRKPRNNPHTSESVLCGRQ